MRSNVSLLIYDGHPMQYHSNIPESHVMCSKYFDLIRTSPWVQCIGRWTLHFLGWPQSRDPSSPAGDEWFGDISASDWLVITVGFLEFHRNPFSTLRICHFTFSSALAGFASHLLYQMCFFRFFQSSIDEIQCMFLVWFFLKLQQNSWPTNRTFSSPLPSTPRTPRQ